MASPPHNLHGIADITEPMSPDGGRQSRVDGGGAELCKLKLQFENSQVLKEDKKNLYLICQIKFITIEHQHKLQDNFICSSFFLNIFEKRIQIMYVS